MKDVITTISGQLSNRRAELGLTQGGVSSRAGVTQSYLSAIERGKIDVRLSTLQDVARALQLELVLVPTEELASVQAILGLAPPPQNKRLFSVEPD